MIPKRVVFVGLARDCGRHLQRFINDIETVRRHFFHTEIYIIENDSKDNTKDILATWAKNSSNVFIDSRDNGTVTIPLENDLSNDILKSYSRINKLVNYRNKYMKIISEMNFDVLVVVDFDLKGFSVNGLVNSINKIDSHIGGIFSYGYTEKELLGLKHRIFYDTYAFRDQFYTENLNVFESNKLKKYIHKQKNNNNLLEVYSAFGGIGVYNFKFFRNREYSIEIDSQGNAICEHVNLNTYLSFQGLKNYLSFELEVNYGEHTYGAMFEYYFPKSYRVVRRILRRVLNQY